MRETLAAMKRYNVVRAVTSEEHAGVEEWRKAAPDRIIPALTCACLTPKEQASVRQWKAEGSLVVLGEIVWQYYGLTPNDPKVEPVWDLAEKLDLPMGIHMGLQPTGWTQTVNPEGRIRNGSPLLLEDALAKHPKARVYVMHAGWPHVDAIRSIVTDINMDWPSVFYTFKDIVPLGAEHTTLDAVVARVAKQLGLKVSLDPMPEQVSFIRSDHYSFVRQGVPSITLGEGLEAKDPNINGRRFVENWIATRYHSPADDMTQPLNFDATVQFMQVAFLTGYDIAQQLRRPAWKPGDFFGHLYAGTSGN